MGQPGIVTLDRLRHGHFFREALEWVAPLQLFEFNWCVLIQELIDRTVATSYANQYTAFLNADVDALRSKRIYTILLAHKHDLKLVAVGEVVDVLCQFHVDSIIAHGYVDCYSSLQVNDIVTKSVILKLEISNTFEQPQTLVVGLKYALLNLIDVA